MSVLTEYLELSTQGNTDIIDITQDVIDILHRTQLINGIVCISAIGSTASVTTCEFESGLVEDLKQLFSRLIPKGSYNHDRAWGDGNGHSHLRASLLGPSLNVVFSNRELILGTWQQIIFIDFDNRSRRRKVVLQFVGE